MSTVKLVKPKGAFLASRLAGVSFKVAGRDWSPSAEERQRIQGFLAFLESRSALYRPFDNQMAHYILQFVNEVKGRVAGEIEKCRKPTIYKESLIAMHAACLKFIEKTQHSVGLEYRLEFFLASCLGEFRAMIGLHIARLACSYDIEVPGEIVAILPHEAEWEFGVAPTAHSTNGNGHQAARVAARRKTRKRSKTAAK